METVKKCSACKKSKSLSEYYKEKKGKFGVKGKCIPCYEEVKLIYKKNNTKKIQEAAQKYHQNPQKRALRKAYRNANKDRYDQIRKDYTAKNKDKLQSYQKEYYDKVKDTEEYRKKK